MRPRPKESGRVLSRQEGRHRTLIIDCHTVCVCVCVLIEFLFRFFLTRLLFSLYYNFVTLQLKWWEYSVVRRTPRQVCVCVWSTLLNKCAYVTVWVMSVAIIFVHLIEKSSLAGVCVCVYLLFPLWVYYLCSSVSLSIFRILLSCSRLSPFGPTLHNIWHRANLCSSPWCPLSLSLSYFD